MAATLLQCSHWGCRSLFCKIQARQRSYWSYLLGWSVSNIYTQCGTLKFENLKFSLFWNKQAYFSSQNWHFSSCYVNYRFTFQCVCTKFCIFLTQERWRKRNSNSYIIFVVFFIFLKEIVGDIDFNQFFNRLRSFWCIICLYSLIRWYLPPIFIWWQYIVTHVAPPSSLVLPKIYINHGLAH